MVDGPLDVAPEVDQLGLGGERSEARDQRATVQYEAIQGLKEAVDKVADFMAGPEGVRRWQPFARARTEKTAKRLAELAKYNVRWDSVGGSSKASMPLGNGDIALNAWMTKDGDLQFYISKTDAWDDNARGDRQPAPAKSYSSGAARLMLELSRS